MLVKPRLKCEGCIKPAARRLALFEAKDEYECYAESYVKCFWGLCDLHKSNEDIIRAPDIKVGKTPSNEICCESPNRLRPPTFPKKILGASDSNIDHFVPVVTDQPRAQELPYNNARIMNDIAVKT